MPELSGASTVRLCYLRVLTLSGVAAFWGYCQLQALSGAVTVRLSYLNMLTLTGVATFENCQLSSTTTVRL